MPSRMDATTVAFGARLQRIRRANPDRPSQDVVARAVGVTTSTYCHYEQGRATPSMAVLRRIASVLDVDPGDLLRERDDAAVG